MGELMEWTRFRTVVLFFGGLAGLGYETIFVHPADPSLLVVFAGMMGLPLFLKGGDGK